jgi:hypothetical protein
MTDEQLALELYAEMYGGGEYELDEEFRPRRLWHRGDLGSIRPSCLWRPVETVALTGGAL